MRTTRGFMKMFEGAWHIQDFQRCNHIAKACSDRMEMTTPLAVS